MNIDWFTLTAQIVNFLILLVLLKKFLFGPLRSIMDKREETVTSRLHEAQQTLTEAEAKDELYRQKLEELEARKAEMMRRARDEAEQYKKDLLHQAREEVNKIQESWEDSIRHEKEIFFSEMHRRTSTAIVELLKQIIKDLADSSLEEQTVNKLLAHLEKLDDEEKRRAIRAALDYGNGELIVNSSFPLSEQQRKKLKTKLTEVFSIDLACRFEVLTTMGFGIELRTDAWKIGWNANIYLDELKKKMDTLFDTEVEIMENGTAKRLE